MQGSTNHFIGLNFWRVTQVSTDRWIGPNFKGGWRDLRTAESVRILKEVCRNPRTAESGRIFKGGYRDLRITESVRIFKKKCRNRSECLKGDVGIRGLLNHAEFLKGDARIYEPPNQFGRIWVILPNIFTISTATCDFHSKHCNYDVMITLSFF